MLLPFLFVFLLICIIAAFFAANGLYTTLRYKLPYVPSPAWAVKWLVDNVKLTDQDIVYELGCGDGRVLVALAKKYPAARFIGIEIQWWPYLLAKWKCRRLTNIDIKRQDFFKVDLSVATVVYGFYISAVTVPLANMLRQELRPGTMVYSYDFPLGGLHQIEEVPSPPGQRRGRILVYRHE